MIGKLITILFLAVVLAGCQDRLFNPAMRTGNFIPVQTITDVLMEADDSFTYRGKPIHPGLVNEFEPWISDLHPITMAVDVSAAYDSNEYSTEPFRDGEWVKINTDSGTYGYRVISSKSGVHILETSDYSGGSQSFGSELWVTFEIWQSQNPDGMTYDQLVMRLVEMR